MENGSLPLVFNLGIKNEKQNNGRTDGTEGH